MGNPVVGGLGKLMLKDIDEFGASFRQNLSEKATQLLVSHG